MCLILAHQVFDIVLKYNDFMIDWKNLPFESDDRLRYNEDLCRKQAKVLFIGNIVFGTLSVLTVASGYFILNRQHQPGTKQHLLCVDGYEWIYLTPVGNVFGTLHQILILMQINITQYVLVRLPRAEGIFKENMMAKVRSGLRDKLLNTAVNEDDEDDGKITDKDYVGEDGKISLGLLLRKIKMSQEAANQDDNFRA